MRMVTGRVDKNGCGYFSRRLKEFPQVFLRATGEVLVDGTLNVKVDRKITIREHFRMLHPWKDEDQVLLFEVCRVQGMWAYRVRPSKLDGAGGGGHSDDTLEIMCADWIKPKDGLPLQEGDVVEVPLFGEELSRKS
jgi:CTP-dependent riboflavin kinase